MIAIDIGNDCMKLARWKKSSRKDLADTSEVLNNDMNDKRTPMQIAFRNQNVNLCDHARTGIQNNLSNYIWSIKRVIGSNSLIEDVNNDIENEHLKSNIKVEKDLVSYDVVFAKEKLNITVEHVLAMILEYAYYLCEKTHDVGFDDRIRVGKKCSDNNDVLITIPSYYTDAHIKGIQIALDAKNYKSAYFIRDYIATAVDYGYYRNLNDEFPKATVVLFVDMGAVATTATLVRYSKNKMEILGTAYEMIGGDDFNYLLKKKLLKLFEEESERTVDEMKEKDRLKQLYLIANKAKKVKEDFSSPNIEDVSIDLDIVDDDDDEIEIELERDNFLEDCEDLFDRFTKFLEDFLDNEDWKVDHIDACELYGGAIRMVRLKEAVREAIKEYGCETISSTLNMDECVVRGACMSGQLCLHDHVLNLPKTVCPFSYEDHSGQIKKHDLVVFGCGENSSTTAGQYVIMNDVDQFNLNDEKPHDWNKVSKRIHDDSLIVDRVIEATAQWAAIRNGAVNEVSILKDQVPEDYEKRQELCELFDDYITFFERLPNESSPELIEEVRKRVEKAKERSQVFVVEWMDIGWREHRFICLKPNEVLDGKYTLYHQSTKDTAFGFCTFKNGKLDGEYQEKSDDRVVLKALYKDDLCVMKKMYNYDGSLDFVRFYDKNGNISRCISFYDKSHIEFIRDFTKSSRFRVYFYKSGVIKRVVVVRKNENWMYEYTKDGYLMYGGDFDCVIVNENGKRKKRYKRARNGTMYREVAGYVKGSFEKDGTVIMIKDKKYDVMDLLNTAKLTAKGKFIKEELKKINSPWVRGKRTKKGFEVELGNTKHRLRKEFKSNKKQYCIHCGLCGCCMSEEDVETHSKRFIFPIQYEDMSSKMKKYYPNLLYWDPEDPDCSNISEEISKEYELSTEGIVVNKDVCLIETEKNHS